MRRGFASLMAGLLLLGLAACDAAQPSNVSQYTGEACWSPNGKYHTPCIEANYPSYVTRVFDDEKNLEGIVMTELKWIEFVGWTRDSRYAIFNGRDQYGNYDAYAFDTDKWRSNLIAYTYWEDPISLVCGSMGDCTYGVVTIAPASSTVLLQNGFLVQLPKSIHSKLLATTEKDLIAKAVWSENEAHLAFVACHRRQHENPVDCALFIATGDDAQVQQIDSLDGYPVKVERGPSPSMVNVETKNTHYSINATTNQVQIVPIH